MSAGHKHLVWLWKGLEIFLLFLVYFLAQYDKFVISYFQVEILSDLDISASACQSVHVSRTDAVYSCKDLESDGLLTGYGTSICLAIAALPLAYLADRPGKRIFTRYSTF